MCFQSALSCVHGAPTQTCTPLSSTSLNTKDLSSEELHLTRLLSLSPLVGRPSRDLGFMAIAQAYSLSIFDRDAYPGTMGTVCYKPQIAAFDQLFSSERPLPTQLPLNKRPAIFRMSSGITFMFFFVFFAGGHVTIYMEACFWNFNFNLTILTFF